MLIEKISNKRSWVFRQLKYLLRDNLYSKKNIHFFFEKARGGRIIVYHGLCKKDHLKFNTLFLTKDVFEEHLKFYKQYFNVISLDDYYEQKIDPKRFNICLSFDDGFANNHKYVLPLLEQYQMPASFFVTAIRDTGYDILWNDVIAIAYKHGPESFFFRNEEFKKTKNKDYISAATGRRLVDLLRHTEVDEKAEIMGLLGSVKDMADHDYWLQMTEEEIKNVSRSKWATIGSHSYFHHDLAKISHQTLISDLIRSKIFLENIINKEVRSLAFPYGSYNEHVIIEAKKAGYRQLLATEFIDSNSKLDQMLQNRLIVNPFISVLNQMYSIINGSY
jgi:peptidoglycan/xylan/chitin deacetylase (PgdA/CDA1 family)